MYPRLCFSAIMLVFLSGCALSHTSEDLMRQEKAIVDLQRQTASNHERIARISSDLEKIRTSLELLRNETAQRLMDMEISLEPAADFRGPGPQEDEFRFEQLTSPDISQVIPEALKMPEPAVDRPKPEPSDERPLPDKALYDKALGLYFAEKPEQARETFQEFTEKYPQSSLMPNAWYWKGETHYMEKDYPRAILTFRQVLEKFPDDPKAPDALLKIGYAYERLGDFRNALFYLGVLTQDYPDSASAGRAADKVRELRDKV